MAPETQNGKLPWFLVVAPFALYLLLAGTITLVEILTGATGMLMLLAPFGSLLFFFYVGWLIFWRTQIVRRMVYAALAPVAVFLFLGIFDLMGVETMHGAHGMSMPNVAYWFTPGMLMSYPVEAGVRHIKPPEPSSIP